MSSLQSRIIAAQDDASRMIALCRTKAASGGGSAPVVAFDNGLAPDGQTSASGNQYSHFRGHAFTAISAIAKRIAGQRIYVGHDPKPGSNGLVVKAHEGQELEPLPAHPILDLLKAPNPIMTSWPLVWSLVASLEITGRAYLWLMPAEEGGQMTLWPIPSHWVEPGNWNCSYWNVTPAGQATAIPVAAQFITPFRLPDPSNPMACISPLQTQAPAIDADEMLQRSQVASFANDGRPGMILRAGRLPAPPGHSGQGPLPVLTEEQRKQLITSINLAYRGPSRHGEPLILDGMIEDAYPFSRSPAEMDYTNSSTLMRSRIFMAFGVNPLIVGEIQGANRAQAVVAEESLCSNVLVPLCTLMSQAMTRWLTPVFSARGERLAVWIDPPRAHDPDQKFREWGLGAGRGAVTVNEFRRNVLNLPDVAGGDVLMGQARPAATG